MDITFKVPAVPIAQPRQRHAVVAGRMRNYTPAKHPVNVFKAAVQMAAATAYDGPPLQGPLAIDLEFVFPRTKQQTWKTKPMLRMRHTKKPDRDNLEKAVFDALKGLVWVDDSQVCAGSSSKWVAAGDEQPGVSVVIRQLDQ